MWIVVVLPPRWAQQAEHLAGTDLEDSPSTARVGPYHFRRSLSASMGRAPYRARSARSRAGPSGCGRRGGRELSVPDEADVGERPRAQAQSNASRRAER